VVKIEKSGQNGAYWSFRTVKSASRKSLMVTSVELLGNVPNITKIPFIINQENFYILEGN